MKFGMPAGALVAAALLAGAASAAEPGGQTLGFVLTGFHLAMHETPGAKDECPDGFQFDSWNDNFRAQFPTEAQQRAQLLKFGGNQHRRGPNGEHAYYEPWAVKDPLPFRELQSKVGYGIDLDDAPNGQATPQTCVHQALTSPEGATGIDNQFYRVSACQRGWRKTGLFDDFMNDEMRKFTTGRFLLEISGVDDLVNDDAVEVRTYKGIDGLKIDASGHVIPGTSQRVDARLPKYMAMAKGKIVNGELITEPFELIMPQRFILVAVEIEFAAARLRLKLSGDGAEGLIAGYMPLDSWWNNYSKVAEAIDYSTLGSAPSTYAALHRLADGDKDPSTGECRSISSAFKTEWVRAFVLHPQPKTTRTAATP